MFLIISLSDKEQYKFIMHVSTRPFETLVSDANCVLRQRQQRERHQTKRLMSKTIAVYVHYIVSLPSSAKQQHEMTKFCVGY